MTNKQQEHWDLIIKPKSSFFQLHLNDVWHYRDLLMMFVRRDFVSVYKQTILGPLWFFIQPVLTTVMFVVVFGNIAKISTDGLPQVLFYLSGITIWNYFAETLNTTSNTFIGNAAIFGKVYFPRLVMPLSKVLSGLIKFGIQYLLFVVAMIFFALKGTAIHIHWAEVIYITPLLLFIMAGLGLGGGLILSTLTTKYRDLTFLISFGIQLLMYATPVIYPLSTIKNPTYKAILLANPMSSVVETFRYIYLGAGELNRGSLLYSIGFMFFLLLLSIVMFNKAERTFMDTV